jgi:hypothetical protein
MASCFGITSRTFRDANVGCLGASLLVLLTAGGALGLVAMGLVDGGAELDHGPMTRRLPTT